MNATSIDRRPPLRRVQFDSGKRNVMTLDAVEELARALAPDDEAPVVVLRGRRDGFCVGLDNATLAQGGVAMQELLTRMGELLLALAEGPTRIVAVCEGHAVAAGAMLLLVSDIRIGVPGAYQIGFTEPRMGMPVPELAALLARERLDRRRLHEFAVLGRTVGPEGAAEAGFLDEVATPDALEDVVAARAEELAALTKASYRGSVASSRGETLERLRAIIDGQRRRLEKARAAG